LLANHFFNLPEGDREEACRDWAEKPGNPHLYGGENRFSAEGRLISWLEFRMTQREADGLLKEVEEAKLETEEEEADLAFSLFNMNPPSS